MSITFSSCFYILKSKFNHTTYISWMNNFISIVHNFYLVIYTDQYSSQFINTLNNPNIKIIIKPLDLFHTYKFKDSWIKNHNMNFPLKDQVKFHTNDIIWEVNMLWNEKISFVHETFHNNYFISDFYGWCDIGYFRNRPEDSNTSSLSNWANSQKISTLSPLKIHYALINNNSDFLNHLFSLINTKNQFGLPIQPIPPYQNSIAGGFFISHKDKIDWWFTTYYHKLQLYFDHNYLVKDDQIIVIDCIFSNINEFSLSQEFNPSLDNWFMFQRILQ